MLALFHEVGILHDVVREHDLLVGLLVHEDEVLTVIIQELIGAAFDGDEVDLGAGGESVLEDAAVLQVAEFRLDESGAFPGLTCWK